ncbi:S1/P1 nuclease [Legionella erythra]|uniref:3'-nucleotidase/nuclease n=1 Tax=Legionella erythra TaxID=448 RepID=A0A0W0TLW2_LEGER|nr:S1/P1 nuclease [Legionella erythra]KTC96567.1 3'-nucleotidase/nuclease [Legionella erythra]
MKKGIVGVMTMAALAAAGTAYSWNATGHRLVAQIAYHHLNKEARSQYVRYNHGLDSVFKSQSLVNAAPWMDGLRYMNDLWLQPMHYIDIPYSVDGTELIQPDEVNAVYAIEKAKKVLKDPKASLFNKGFSLRILLHVVGDIHQPLHAISQFSVQHPKGDMGGNLVMLGDNPVGPNLHSYWDNGGGFLKTARLNTKQLNAKAWKIEQRWPCHVNNMTLDAKAWSQESYQLAIAKAYQIKNGEKPSNEYQDMVKVTAEQRIALAGCRLAALLNDLM